MKKKFKRHFTGSDARARAQGNGKGSDRREAQVSEQEIAENYCRSFGCKYWPDGTCKSCGKPKEASCE